MTQNAEVNQAADVWLSIVVHSDAAQTQAKDLTGATIVAYRVGRKTVRRTLLELDATANATGSVVEFGNRAAGEVIVKLSPEDLAALPAMQLVHQLTLVDAGGFQAVCLDGRLTVRKTLPADLA